MHRTRRPISLARPIRALVAALLIAAAVSAPADAALPDGVVPHWAPAMADAAVCAPGVATATLLAGIVEKCEAWVTRHDEPTFGPDDLGDVAVSPIDGTVFITGITDESGSLDVVTLALDPALGLVKWTSRVDTGSFIDVGRHAAVTPDGATLIVAGNTFLGGYNYLVLALDTTTGDLRWTQSYNGPGGGYDGVEDLALSPDGARVFVTGESQGDGTRSDATTLALDAATGEILWEERIDGPVSAGDSARAIATSPDGALVYVTGHLAVDPQFPKYELLTVAYDAATGDEVWRTTFGLTEWSDSGRAIAVTPDGSRVIVAGQTLIDGFDYLTVAHDAATGAVLWWARYAHMDEGGDAAEALVITPDGSRVVVTGGSENEPWDDEGIDFATIAYDVATGAEIWVQRYDGPEGGHDRAYELVLSGDGSCVIVAGVSATAPLDAAPHAPARDAATLAYDVATGALVWEARYNGPLGAWDETRDASVSPDGARVYVAGATEGVDGTDYLVLAYNVA